MEFVTFGLVLLGTVIVALGVARLVLGGILGAMTGQLPVGAFFAHWKRVAAVGALFWLAYLIPVIAASESVPTPMAQLIRLLRP